MKKKIAVILAWVVVAFSLILLGGSTKYWVGVSKDNIESNAKLFQGISENWITTQETTDTMSAMLFYSNDYSDFAYSIYLNKPGFSFGYFFRIGGTISEIEDSILAVSFDGYSDIAYLSMNNVEINSISVDDGNKIETIKIDSAAPFVVILSNNAGNVTFFDVNEATVDFVCREFPK